VKAIDDCTVEGRAHRNRMPRYRSGVSSASASGFMASPSSGNITKVLASTSRCSRQCVRPDTSASRDSLAPWRKNSRPMAKVVTWPRATAAPPEAGRKLARATITISRMV
jgi:hypothetical protein